MKRKFFFGTLVIIALVFGFTAWQVFGPTVSAPADKYFYIKTGTTYTDVKSALVNQEIIGNIFFFDLLAKQIKYDQKVKAGRYEIKKLSNVYNLLRALRSGRQSPVKLVINKLRTKEDLAQKLAANFECDSLDVMRILNSEDSLKQYNLNIHTAMTAIVPNTYDMFWNNTASKIFKKLEAEKNIFWTDDRKAKARKLNLTTAQVYILASIVEEETNKLSDKGKIASVYMNRIKTGMKLQADPTVRFAIGDFAITRVMHKHLTYPSPYNTYQNLGLPPGPICTPSITTIDAVLDAPSTDYIFFVAKPDFNGYSNFANSYAQHLVYAKAYQQALDKLMQQKAQ